MEKEKEEISKSLIAKSIGYRLPQLEWNIHNIGFYDSRENCIECIVQPRYLMTVNLLLTNKYDHNIRNLMIATQLMSTTNNNTSYSGDLQIIFIQIKMVLHKS